MIATLESPRTAESDSSDLIVAHLGACKQELRKRSGTSWRRFPGAMPEKS